MRTITRAAATVAAAGTIAVMTPAIASADDSYLEPCRLDNKVAELNEYGSRTGVNVMVWKASQESSSHFDGVVQEGSISKTPCDEVPIGNSDEYKWVVFTGEGQFVRQGDGGYRNWAFSGFWDRPEDTVVNFTPAS
jgi:hypothetical protein